MLTIERLRSVIDYDPRTGVLRWKVRQSIRVQAGDVIESAAANGHLRVSIDYRRYLAHRVAWFHHFGEWPKGRLDHRNGNAADNRIDNLRVATPSQNGFNRGAQGNNLSGLKGVSYDARRGYYFSRICIDGRQTWLGRFDTARKAHNAYRKAAKKLHGEFACTARHRA
jgi:hypothetical protein